MPGEPLRVCIDARRQDGTRGGVQQTLIGLAAGLSRLDGDEEYLFLAEPTAAWLKPYLGGRCVLLEESRAPAAAWKRAVKRVVPAALLDPLYLRFHAAREGPPPSDGSAERAGSHVLHLALQAGFTSRLPTIYVPHDLQHLHFPGFFSPEELRWREAVYRALCREARAVVALSAWGKRDLVERFGLDPGSVYVIGWAPVLDAYGEPTPAELAEVRRTLGLPPAFIYFPAQTYPHKNHAKLLEALALARDAGVRIDLVCSGHRSANHAALARRVRELRLEDQVRFVGFVPERTVKSLYLLARALVFPSLFEGFGLPIVEAFRAGLPVTTSAAGSLAEVAGDAALLFDPADPADIAAAVLRLWRDGELRDELVRRGARRVQDASWVGVARRYRALYRRVAGRPPGAGDEALLEEMTAWPGGGAGP